jgi:hypothetical protein
MFTDFNTNPPAGLPDPSRAVSPVGPGRMVIVGGSNPQDGMNPLDLKPGTFGPPNENTVWGLTTQAQALGGNVI